MFDVRTTVQRFFESPAELLSGIMTATRHETAVISDTRSLKVAEEYFHTLGPGLVSGAADDDPSGIATYSQTGARYGFQLLWLSLFTFPFMAIVQEMCARIGLVTGRGLAANIRRHYSVHVLYVVCTLLFVANTLNIAADLGAMAASARLVVPHVNALVFVIIFALSSMLLQIYTTYARYARILKWLTLALLSYVCTAFIVELDWTNALAHTLVPSMSFSKEYILLLCAILGTTISPYIFFWQTSQEVEERRLADGTDGAAVHRVNTHDAASMRTSIRNMRIDVWSGMFFSNAVMFFIIAACGATLYAHGITTIETADQAALAIRPFGGELTYLLFAIGIIGTGFLAVPVLAGSSAYAIAESFGWKRGLYHELTQAYAFYGVIIVSFIIAVIANAIGFDPIKGLIFAAIVNGLVAPVVLFFIVHLSGKLRTYGNHPLISLAGWTITVLMMICGIAAIFSLFA